mmetsp:Transcript_625/g.983  ORF Transcript_625/g.983 Transcript_625/m.983 type:complete len:420 (+) Transcript_625:70-1329(+)
MKQKVILCTLCSSVLVSYAFYLPYQRSKPSELRYFDDASRYSPIDEWLDQEAYTQRQMEAKASVDKMEMIKSRIIGYNAASASQLTRKEVKKKTRDWIKKSGTIGQMEGTELFENLAGIKVCRESDIVGCIAYFWRIIVKDILQVDRDGRDHSVYMVVFPNCKALYTYDNLKLLNQAITLGSEICMYLGSEVSLTLFHPSYKNSPKMFSPERHSPFPTSGVQFRPNKNLMRELPKDNTLYVDKQRIYLERIFNSAAGSSPFEETGSASLKKEDNLNIGTPDAIIKMTQEWLDDNKYIENKDANQALKYMETTSGWFVSKAIMAEEAYADVWGIIYQLLKQPSEQDVISAILVAPSFSLYNAVEWRKFAITINAALKRTTEGKMKLELFHPEFVYAGKNRKCKDRRTTPFPTLQIIFQRC